MISPVFTSRPAHYTPLLHAISFTPLPPSPEGGYFPPPLEGGYSPWGAITTGESPNSAINPPGHFAPGVPALLLSCARAKGVMFGPCNLLYWSMKIILSSSSYMPLISLANEILHLHHLYICLSVHFGDENFKLSSCRLPTHRRAAHWNFVPMIPCYFEIYGRRIGELRRPTDRKMPAAPSCDERVCYVYIYMYI